MYITNIFQKHEYLMIWGSYWFLISLLLGCADREFALFQHSTKLFVVNIGELTRHLFHQLTLLNFGNADVIQLNPPADIKEMTLLG